MSNCPCALCSPPVDPVSRQIYDIERKPYTRAMLYGREQERAAIVAWLRSNPYQFKNDDKNGSDCAEAIGRGDDDERENDTPWKCPTCGREMFYDFGTYYCYRCGWEE